MSAAFGFLDSGVLWWLLLTAPIFVWLVGAERVRLRLLVQFGRMESPRRFVALGPVLVVAAAVCALARPHRGFEDVRVPGAGRDIFLIVDVSRSMLADDVSPHRLGIAKRKVADIIDRVAQTSPGDRIGIVLFAGEAYLFCPLTADYTVVRAFANAIAPELISTGGSALTAALEIVVGSVDATKARYPLVVLLSDGEEIRLDPERIGAALRRRDITVNPLAIGTSEGRALVGPDGRFYRNSRGETVISKVNLPALEAIAHVTGGVLHRPTVNESDIVGLLRGGQVSPESTASGESRGARTVRTYQELGPLLATIILAVLLLGAVLGRLRPVVWVVALLLLPAAGQADQGERRSAYAGARSYAAGRYADTITALTAELAERGSTWALHQGLGAAHYRTGDFVKSAKEFGRAADLSGNGRERFESLYSRGNARFRHGEFGAAIDDYDAALRIKPGDEDATFNRELAKKMLATTPPPPKPTEKDDRGAPPNEHQHSSEANDSSSERSGERSRAPEKESSEGDSPRGQSDEGAADESPGAHPSPTGAPPDPSGSADPGERGAQASTSGEESNDSSRADGSAAGDEAAAEPPPEPESRDTGGTAPPSGETPQGSEDSSTSGEGPSALRGTDPKSWLQSLGEAPVLLERRGARGRHQGEQAW
jgi:Ca-activated chloride channel family protein